MVLLPLLRVLLRLQIKGPRLERDDKGLIVAMNHQSWIDPPLLQLAVYPHRITFLMTEIYFDRPVMGLYFRAVGCRPIREGGPSVSGLRAAREALEAGEVVCIFPEGEITTTGQMAQGQRGVARLARRTGAAVLPLGIRGAIDVYSKVQTRPQRAAVELRRGRPVRYDKTPDREGESQFTAELMETIRRLAYD